MTGARAADPTDAEYVALLGAPVQYTQAHPDGVTHLRPDDLVAHGHRFGARPSTTGGAGAELIEALDAIRLSGRGGSHFPAAAKWRAVRAAGSGVVVANGAEGEPLSRKDAALLQLRPHLVLDGLALATEALGAHDGVIWLHDGATASQAAVSRALRQRRAAGVVEPQMRVALAPDRYLSGESSTAVNALSGGPSLPMFRRESATVSGVNGHPTLVQNVETLARAAIAARDADIAIGSTLVTVAVAHHKIVLEVPETATVRDAVDSVLGPASLQAVLIGGYGGSWATWSDVADVALNETALRATGVSLGAGVLMPLRAGTCGIRRTAEIAAYMADSSARQCGPCLFGLRAIADLLLDLADCRSKRRDPARLERFLAEVDGRGACRHPDGVVRMVASGLRTFADDVTAHLGRGCLHDRSGWGGPGTSP